ncbi:MAG: condensation domain-containing protein, partial [Saprospiraceae bacterium]|nr:condensation domain-containing protein [Saprospiraceae bacterium]
MLITIHHIISDGWSVHLLYRDLSSIYVSLIRGRTIDTTTDPPGFVTHLRSHGQCHPDKTESVLYWQVKLQNCPPECRFPPDHLTPNVQSFDGDMVRSQFDASLFKKIRSAAALHGVTPFIFLLTVFYALLYRYSGQTDNIVGTAVAGRDTQASKEITGCFANTVVLRSSVSGEMTFADYLHAVACDVQSALDHAGVSLLEMIHGANIERQQGRNPVFQTMFVLQDFPVLPLGTVSSESIQDHLSRSVVGPGDLLLERGFDVADGLHAFPWQHDIGSTKFDLTLYLKPGLAGMHLDWQFRSCLYEKETIRRVADHFVDFVEQVVNDPTQAIESYSLPWYGV